MVRLIAFFMILLSSTAFANTPGCADKPSLQDRAAVHAVNEDLTTALAEPDPKPFSEQKSVFLQQFRGGDDSAKTAISDYYAAAYCEALVLRAERLLAVARTLAGRIAGESTNSRIEDTGRNLTSVIARFEPLLARPAGESLSSPELDARLDSIAMLLASLKRDLDVAVAQTDALLQEPIAGSRQTAAYEAPQDAAPSGTAQHLEENSKPSPPPSPRYMAKPRAPGLPNTDQENQMKDAAPQASDKAQRRAEDAGSPNPEDPVAVGVIAAPVPVSAECRALGVFENCTDYSALLSSLKDTPVEYNHPAIMYQGRKTQISLVLRTDWKGEGTPATPSEEMKGLSGEIRQGATKVTQVMSARLAGAEFDIKAESEQKQAITTTSPVVWTWFVTPTETGSAKRLKLQLYAHVQKDGQEKPALLIKTLDASIDVDVKTWDWIVNQAQTIDPIFGLLATCFGVLTAFFTFFYRRSPIHKPHYAERKNRYLSAGPSEGVSSISNEAAAPAASKHGSSLAHKPWFPNPGGGDGKS